MGVLTRPTQMKEEPANIKKSVVYTRNNIWAHVMVLISFEISNLANLHLAHYPHSIWFFVKTPLLSFFLHF